MTADSTAVATGDSTAVVLADYTAVATADFTCFMDLVWAADPTRDTDKPTLMAGRIPL